MEKLTRQEVKEKLSTLSAKGVISKTPSQIKKMNENIARIELEKYEQHITQETTDKLKMLFLTAFQKHYIISKLLMKRILKNLRRN